MNHNHPHPETPTKIPPDIHTSAMQLTVPTVYLDKAEKAAAKAAAKLASRSREDGDLQQKQDVKGSITNIIVILRAINMEMQYEQDQEILLVLSQQKEIFDKILAQKQTGQKYSLRTVENEIISQLQNQVKTNSI